MQCELWFNLNSSKANMDWAELEVDKGYDKKSQELSITVLSKNGKNRTWLNSAEIFAKYKNGWRFW